MKHCMTVLTLAASFLAIGCSDRGSELQSPQHERLANLSAPAVAQASVVDLNFVDVATGVDEGPQDGVFDGFLPDNLGSVNNNGWTNLRTAFEFSLADVPVGSTINSATLTVVLFNFEGTRWIQLHGYRGDGTVQLDDFALNGLVGDASIDPSGGQTLVFDVTAFVADLVASGGAFAGFNVREEPANEPNYTIMRLDLAGLPLLSVGFSPVQVVGIDIKPGSVRNPIQPRARGKVPVAILSSPTFDAPSAVDARSLLFGRTGNEPSLRFCNAGGEDVNRDGRLDLVCHFDVASTGFVPGDKVGVLKGKTLGGVMFRGTDSVRIVP